MSVLFWQNLKKITTLELLDKVLVGKNSNGKSVYADVNQFRNLIGAVANGAIVPQIVPSNDLGSPAEMKIYYAPAGAYTTDDVGITLNANFNILIWDLERWTHMAIPIVTFAESRLEAVEEKIGALTTHQYYKDMSAYTSVLGGSDFYANPVPLQNSAVLQKVRVKSNIQVWIHVKCVAIDTESNVSTVLHDYGTIASVTESGLEVLNITDAYLMPVGSFLSFSNTAGGGFVFDTHVQSGGYKIVGNAVSSALPSAVDFSVLETDNLASLLYRVFALEANVIKVQSDIITERNKNNTQDDRLYVVEEQNNIFHEKANEADILSKLNKGRLDILEPDFVDAQNDIAQAQSDINVLKPKVDAFDTLNTSQRLIVLEGWKDNQTTRIDTIDTEQNQQDVRLDGFETFQNNTESRLDTVEVKANNLQEQITFQAGRITPLETNQATFITEQNTQNTDIEALGQRLLEVEGFVDTGDFVQRLGTVESGVSEANSNISQVLADIQGTGGLIEIVDYLEGKMVTADNDIAILQNVKEEHIVDIADLKTDKALKTNQISNLQGRVTALENNQVPNVGTRLGTLETAQTNNTQLFFGIFQDIQNITTKTDFPTYAEYAPVNADGQLKRATIWGNAGDTVTIKVLDSSNNIQHTFAGINFPTAGSATVNYLQEGITFSAGVKFVTYSALNYVADSRNQFEYFSSSDTDTVQWRLAVIETILGL